MRTGPDRSSIAAVAAITLVGALLRWLQIDQSVIGDEMWSWTAATNPTFGGMLDFVRSPEEITPPLFTTLAWLSGRISDAPEVLRLPSFLAGVATIPIVYGIGIRTVGRRAALLATVLAALSPFLIWYSVELRAYGLVVALTAGSTLCLLIAIADRRARWWVAYAVLSCAAMYTHYTAAYVLAAQAIWALLAHPQARRPVLLANLGAAVAFLPWVPSFHDDLQAPSQHAIENLTPLSLHFVADFGTRFAFGSPAVTVRELPGTAGIVVMAAAIVVAVAGLIARRRAEASPQPRAAEPEGRSRLVLVAVLALAAPVGVVLVSLIGDDQLLPRNLATSAPGLLLALAALVTAGTAVSRVAATTAVVAVFAFGAARTLDASFQRQDYDSAAELIDAEAGPDDVVLDIAVFVGGIGGKPLSPPAFTLGRAFEQPHNLVEGVDDPSRQAALDAAAGHRLFLVGHPYFVDAVRKELHLSGDQPALDRTFEGVPPLEVEAFEIPGAER